MSNFMNEKFVALSFDIEDWFTVRNMRSSINEEQWDDIELRVHIGVDFILQALEKKNIKATFFILGWIAKKVPSIVRKIQDQGHEIATHGQTHRPIDLMTPSEFKEDLAQSIQIIQDISGTKVKGFRAPSFSITKKTLWALDIIQELGLEYDSSIFSTLHPDYGISQFPRNIVDINGLVEVPLKKSDFFGIQIPSCGGGYFRLLPYWIVKNSLKNTISEENQIMYFHPWEFDPLQPRIAMPRLKRFRHYVGLKKNKNKFEKLLNDFNFTTIENLILLEKEKNLITKLDKKQILSL